MAASRPGEGFGSASLAIVPLSGLVGSVRRVSGGSNVQSLAPLGRARGGRDAIQVDVPYRCRDARESGRPVAFELSSGGRGG